MKKNRLLSLIASAFLIASCSITPSHVIKGPSEDGGLEGNAESDRVELQSTKELEDMFKRVYKLTKFSYEVQLHVGSNNTHFVNYFSNNAFYAQEDYASGSFGLAQNRNGEIFKFYLNNGVATPSLFQYEEDTDGLVKVKDLYSIFSIAHISMIGSYMDEFSAVNIGPNKFTLTNDNIVSIFQFMSMYGMSIAGYLSGCSVEVLDFETNHFKVVLDLGSYGSITSTFTDLTSTGTPIDQVSLDAYKGTINGIEYHEEIKDLCDNYLTKDNFILSGIKQNLASGVSTEYPYEIHCTEDYFYVDYTSAFSSYTSWGCALINANTEITYVDGDGSHTKKVPYDACYGFKKNKDGTFTFDSFIGPLPSFGEEWIEVETLPETGLDNTLYIIKEAEGKVAYRWCQVSEGVYGYAKYSSWMNTIGEVPFDGASATYYLDKTPVGTYAPNYFEKTGEHQYRTSESLIYQSIASAMFGWGFQGTTTWMDYINDAFINIKKNGEVIESADIGLHVTDSSGRPQGIYYTMHDWGKGNVASVDSFLNGKIGG